MKRIFIGIFTMFAITFCGISQSSTNHFPKYDNFNNPPNTFASEKELRENMWVHDSRECEASEKKFFVCLSSFPSAGTTKDRVTCWYRLPKSDKLVRVWDVRLVDAGTIKFEYDKETTRLSVITLANFKVGNTPMKGQPVASVVLTLLGTGGMDVDV